MADDFAAGQPFAPYWHPNDLLRWTPARDPDAPYNRSRVPLADRFRDPATQANPHARGGEARVAALSAFGPTSKNPSQGSARFDTYAFGYWQYTDVLVYWGGSAGEGLILAPKPTVVDAAHRNGVPVLGTIFLPPVAYGGRIAWVRDLVQRRGNTFPVADKLIEAAHYYGFDGWFVNQETAGGDAALAAEVRAFLRYLKARSRRLRLMWYDAMIEEGPVRWQGALNDANDSFFEDRGRVADEMFLDFRWSPARLASSRERAQRLRRDAYDLYAGVDVEANGYNRPVRWDALFPEGLPHVVSLGFYRPDWAFNSAADPADFSLRDNRFWVGPNGDPAGTATVEPWKGVAHYIPERSPINDVPFVTHFNTGQGRLFAVDGEIAVRADWNNLSLQDILPTWRWRIDSNGDRLRPELVWAEAYHGGTSLKVSGVLNAANHLKLYRTRLAVRGDTRLRIACKTGAPGAPTHLQVGLAFEGNPTRFEFLDVGATEVAGWNVKTFALGRHAGKKIAVLSLRFAADAPVGDYTIHIGEIAVFNGAIATPGAPFGLRVERAWGAGPNRVSLRLRWEESKAPVRAYYLYRRNRDGSRTFLGGTPNTAYFVPGIERSGAERTLTIEVEAVGPDFGRSRPAMVAVG